MGAWEGLVAVVALITIGSVLLATVVFAFAVLIIGFIAIGSEEIEDNEAHNGTP